MYGMHDDTTDEYIKMLEFTTIECIKRLCRAFVKLFAEWYLTSPTSLPNFSISASNVDLVEYWVV